jgi:hypothetical protein
MRAAIPHMARQGGGAIVNTSSASGLGHPSHAAYATAKEGLIGLTRTAAMELGRFGIRCNAIRPFAITRQVAEYNEHSARWRRLMDLTMGPSATGTSEEVLAPSKIAPFAVWLCTDAAQGVTGCTFLLVGDRVSLLAEPRPKRSIEQVGGWTLDDLDRVAPEELVPGMVNRWALADHPDLQVFPDEAGGVRDALGHGDHHCDGTFERPTALRNTRSERGQSAAGIAFPCGHTCGSFRSSVSASSTSSEMTLASRSASRPRSSLATPTMVKRKCSARR